jgi:hypothetical protein
LGPPGRGGCGLSPELPRRRLHTGLCRTPQQRRGRCPQAVSSGRVRANGGLFILTAAASGPALAGWGLFALWGSGLLRRRARK